MSDELKKYWNLFVSGDKSAFGKIYEHYKPILTFYCLGLLKSMPNAENCSSEVLIKVYNQARPEEIKNPESWLFTLAKNLCISQLRQMKSRDNILHELNRNQSKTEIPGVELQQNAEVINRLIEENLNESELKIWKLHAEGFNNKEISDKLDINEKTIANRKSEIRNRLRKLVKQHLRS